MDLEELKRRREENLKAHKKKKKEYYLKKKLEKQAAQAKETKAPPKVIDYAKEFSHGVDFAVKFKEIAKAQKAHVDDRKDIIVAKIQEYKKRKQDYYKENKDKRLAYDKAYREKKKEDLKKYRKEYYEKNREAILEKQRLARQKNKENKES